MSPKIAAATLVTLAMVAGAGPARADSHACGVLAEDLVQVDGRLDEWPGIPPVRVGAPGDAGLKWRCGYDGTRLFLAFDIYDERVVRTRRARAMREDSVIITLSGMAKGKLGLELFPGSVTAKPVRKVNGRRRVPRWIVIEDSLSPHGFTMEVAIPLARIPGYRSRTAEITAELSFRDSDRAMARALEDTLTWHGTLELLGKANALRGFLNAVGKSRADIDRSELVDVGGEAGKERMVVADKFVGIIGDGFRFLELPVAAPADVIAVKAIDLEGHGRHDIAVQFIQHGNGGSRLLLEVWRVAGDGALGKVLAVELEKHQGDKAITSKWRFADRRRGGKVLIVEVEKAENWDATSYREARAADADPILLPWGDLGRVLYLFEDGQVKKRTFPRKP